MTRSILLALPVAIVLLNSANGAPSLVRPPPIPSVYPAIDQTVMITGSLLTAPLVADALAYVESVVPAELLNLPVSTYISGSTVTYKAGANYCYWPANQCVRTAPTAAFNADIVSCPKANTWGLTYDDGPTSNIVNGVHNPDTAAIRTALDDLNVKATFFVCGTGVRSLPAQVVNSFKAGHQIAVHTWTHHPLTSLTNAQIVAEIKYTEAAIYEVIGVVPTHFRPPYGDIDDRVRAIASALGYKTVIWGVDSLDADVAATPANAATVQARIESWFKAGPGFISLEHDISTFTSGIAVNALAEVKKQVAAGTFPLTINSVAQCVGESGYWNANVSAAGTSASIASATSTTTSTTTTSTTTSTATTTTTTSSSTTTTSTSTTSTTTRAQPTTATQSKDITSGAEGLTSYLGQLVLAGLAAVGLQLL